MSDHIELRAMRFEGRHGVLPAEAIEPQPFEVDIVLRLGLVAAGRRDELARTVDYGSVFEIARSVVEGPHIGLLETIAERIAGLVLATHTSVAAVTVRVRKMQPPLPGRLAWAGVEIHRAR
jgi:dihydroneopterin aldolase